MFFLYIDLKYEYESPHFSDVSANILNYEMHKNTTAEIGKTQYIYQPH